MSKKSFKELKAQFKQEQEQKKSKNDSFQNNDIYPFWQMKGGEECVVRILPDANENNPAAFPISVEYLEHKLMLDGKQRSIASLETWGEDDPIAQLSQKYYKMGDEAKGKMYWRNKINLLRALIIKDPLPEDTETKENAEGKIKTLRFGFQLMGTLLAGIASDDIDIEPWDMKHGFDFRIMKTSQGKDKNGKEQFTYAIGSGFVRNSTDISDKGIELTDLNTLLPAKPTLEKVQRLLDAHLGNGEYDENDESGGDSEKEHDDDDTPEKVEKVSKNVKSDKKPDESSASVVEEDEDDEDDDIIARIRKEKRGG